jgi:hypothetical protein
MFKLIKLAIYVFLGYALYELYQGAMSGSGAQSGSRAGAGGRSRQGRMTGRSASGMSETTQEPAGTSQRHQVGRGVV